MSKFPGAASMSGQPSKKLDIRHPPERGRDSYLALVDRLDELRRELDEALVTQAFLRRWEASLMAELTPKEVDRLMSRPDAPDDFITDDLADVRWRNLRAILLARKGVPARYLTD